MSGAGRDQGEDVLTGEVSQGPYQPPEPLFVREHLSHACHGVLARAVVEQRSPYAGTLILLEPSRGFLRQSFGYQPRFAPPPRIWQGGRLSDDWITQLRVLIEDLVVCWLPFELHHDELLAEYRRAAAELRAAFRASAEERRRFGAVRLELRARLEQRALTTRAYTAAVRQLEAQRARCSPPEPSGLLWEHMVTGTRRIVGHDVDARALTVFLDVYARDAGCGWHLSRHASSIAPPARSECNRSVRAAVSSAS